MLLNNIEYNCTLKLLANQVHQSQCFDRTFCDLNKDLKHLTLINYTNYTKCLYSNKNITDLNVLLSSIINKYYNNCNNCNKKNSLVNIIKDNSIEFYCKNPNCCPLSLQEIIAKKINFEFSIKTEIKN